jgi:hypothetical protein
VIIDLNDPTFTPPPPRVQTETERLRHRVDRLVAQLGDDFSAEMVGRALLAKGADVLMANSGMTGAIWGVQRCEDLLAGHWTKDTTDLFISTPNR